MIAKCVALILASVFVAGIVIGFVVGHSNHTAKPQTCTFDGGGTIQLGEMGKTSQGTIWACTDGGVLVEVTYP